MSTALPDSRRFAILERVARDGEVRVTTLAEDLGVSPITVRRDLTRLAQEQLIEQVHGGARRTAGTPASTLAEAAGPAGYATQATLAMVAPSLQYYWPTIVSGARHAASEHGARLLVQASSASAEDNLAVLDQLTADPSIDALILAPDLRSGAASERLLERLQGVQLPVVLAERSMHAFSVHGRSFDSVRTDHASGAAMALRHLRELGHERVTMLCDPFSPTRPLLEQGFERASTELGFDARHTHTGTIDTHGNSPFEAIDAFLDRCREQGTTAALIHSDEAALLVLQHAQRRGWSVPHDLSIVSYDDELSELAHPPLTAVAPPKQALGERAVLLALGRLRQPDCPIERVELLPSLRTRSSTAAPGTAIGR